MPPHFGQAKGSTSYTRLMSMAQVWLQRRAGGAAADPRQRGQSHSSPRRKLGQSRFPAALRRMPRDLFEYQP